MCDTIAVVEPDRVLFAKNSDREANEGQNLAWSPRRRNGKGAWLTCTYIEIPDVEETHATLLSQPFWMWGAEMGVNEHGVAIGNEAVFTKEPYEKDPGLIGMDLLRLGLERGATAREAVDVITALLSEYGQGGGCGLERKDFTYHNSFIVADPKEAYVLETVGRAWAVERVTQGPRTISNGLTIPELTPKADPVQSYLNGCRIRRGRTTELARSASGVLDLMNALRDHGEGRIDPHYQWTVGGLWAPCVHGGGVIKSSQTTASWVSELRPGGCPHWATATAAPCVGLFKPIGIDQPLQLARATDHANDSLWWRHERFHRAVMRDPQRLRPLFSDERDRVQADWIANPPTSEEAFAKADALLEEWTARVLSEGIRDTRPIWARRFWAKRDVRAGLDAGPEAQPQPASPAKQ